MVSPEQKTLADLMDDTDPRIGATLDWYADWISYCPEDPKGSRELWQRARSLVKYGFEPTLASVVVRLASIWKARQHLEDTLVRAILSRPPGLSPAINARGFSELRENLAYLDRILENSLGVPKGALAGGSWDRRPAPPTEDSAAGRTINGARNLLDLAPLKFSDLSFEDEERNGN